MLCPTWWMSDRNVAGCLGFVCNMWINVRCTVLLLQVVLHYKVLVHGWHTCATPTRQWYKNVKGHTCLSCRASGLHFMWWMSCSMCAINAVQTRILCVFWPSSAVAQSRVLSADRSARLQLCQLCSALLRCVEREATLNLVADVFLSCTRKDRAICAGQVLAGSL